MVEQKQVQNKIPSSFCSLTSVEWLSNLCYVAYVASELFVFTWLKIWNKLRMYSGEYTSTPGKLKNIYA